MLNVKFVNSQLLKNERLALIQRSKRLTLLQGQGYEMDGMLTAVNNRIAEIEAELERRGEILYA